MARPNSTTGAFPQIVLCAGLGLLLCAGVNAMERATLEPPMALYWLGVLIVTLPIFYRLTSREASTGERFALVCLLGLALYAIKIFHDAPQFTFFDELIHSYNARQVGDAHQLFQVNSILEVTKSFPGLAGATTAIMALTGLSVYPAGLVVVGAARLVLVGALFLLFLRIGGSGRIAGLGVAIYVSNFNFLSWGAQYAYESLALPLLVLVMMALAERESSSGRSLQTWATPAVLGIAAIVVTHHLTSYATAGFLALLSIAYWFAHRNWRSPNPWPFAAIAVALSVTWLFVVASSTVGYLTPVLGNAIEAIWNTILGEDPPRGVFESSSEATPATPLLARIVALGALALLALGLPTGLQQIWRRYRNQPFALLFAVAALGFFGTLALRLTPPAWETGNRASEFLFIGLAFVLACTVIEALRRWSNRKQTRPLVTTGLGVLLVGGAISGWPWDSQLAQPMRISANGGTIVSPPLSMAEWASERVRDGRFAANTANAGLLLEPGEKFVLTGRSPAIEALLESEQLEDWQLPLLRQNRLRYVVSDRREVGDDTLRGYFFSRSDSPPEELVPKSAVTKLNRVPRAARMYTNGTITIFDMEARR